MTTTISKSRVEKMHPYHQYTVAKGQWCCEVDVSGLTAAQADRLYEVARDREWSIYLTCPDRGSVTIYTTTTGAAKTLARTVERLGGLATITRGKGHFTVRGYYDDCGCDFVAGDK